MIHFKAQCGFKLVKAFNLSQLLAELIQVPMKIIIFFKHLSGSLFLTELYGNMFYM